MVKHKIIMYHYLHTRAQWNSGFHTEPHIPRQAVQYTALGIDYGPARYELAGVTCMAPGLLSNVLASRCAGEHSLACKGTPALRQPPTLLLSTAAFTALLNTSQYN